MLFEARGEDDAAVEALIRERHGCGVPEVVEPSVAGGSADDLSRPLRKTERT